MAVFVFARKRHTWTEKKRELGKIYSPNESPFYFAITQESGFLYVTRRKIPVALCSPVLYFKKTFTIYSPELIEHLKYHTFVIDLVDYHTRLSLTSCVSHAQFSTICYVQVRFPTVVMSHL